MGGTSTQQQTQQSTTAPWEAAQPMLQGILGQVQGNLGNTGVTGAENSALNTVQNNAANFSSNVAPQIGANANELLAGGGALNQAGATNQNYQDYVRRLAATADGSNIGANSALQPYLDTIRNDVTNQVNGSFAAAGRDFSGANFNALGRGISAGLAPVVAQQFNTDTANQRGAADALYGAGNTNAGILSGMQQQALANKQLGTQAASQAMDAQNAGANSTLAAEAARRGIPVQALGLLAQIGIPIGSLGGQSQGTSNTTNEMSGAQQFGLIANGLGSMFGAGGGSGGGGAASGMLNFLGRFSDRRLKEHITQVGTLFDGTPVYRYCYKGDPVFQIGLMAQDIEKTTPAAVLEVNGFKAVDYKAATENAVSATRKVA